MLNFLVPFWVTLKFTATVAAAVVAGGARILQLKAAERMLLLLQLTGVRWMG